MAASMAMVHTLTMNAEMNAIRVQEVGGPLNSDILYTVDAEPMDTKVSTDQLLQFTHLSLSMASCDNGICFVSSVDHEAQFQRYGHLDTQC